MGRLQRIQGMSSFAETKANTPSLHIRNIDYHQLEESPYQYRDLTPESVHRLADIILLDGRVLEPLIVRKKAGDTFEILSGHKRYRACKYLVEKEQEESFSMIPCCVMNDMDDVRAEFTVYSTNAYEQKTSYEITQEINGMKKLLDSYPETFQRPKGKRTVEMIAEELHLSPSTVKVHQAISNRLGESGMEQYKEGSLTKDAAYELSKLPVEKQDSLLEKGVTTAKEIKKTVEKPKRENPVSDSDTSEPGIFDFSHIKTNETEKTESKEPGFNKPVVSSTKKKNRIINPQKQKLEEAVYVGTCPFCKSRLIFDSGFNYCGFCGHEVLWILEEGGEEKKYGFDEEEK